ncbi:MAG: RluA family pseudouridine synthase [Verrucomicrobiota bacterium]
MSNLTSSPQERTAPFAAVVDANASGMRLDRFLAELRPDFSRARLQGFIRDGHATVNHSIAKPSWPLREGDAVVLEIPAETAPSPLAAQEMPLGILFEDDHLLVLDKPAGLVVHPGAGNREGTLANGLLHHCAGIEIVGGTERPGIVHRLDKETSGCLVVAKTESAHRQLAAQFASRDVEKTYLALVDGKPRMPHGTIDAAIGRHPVHRQKMAVVERGRDALTHYRVLESRDGKALVQCQPKTGRTHQIRVHLKHLGHPVAGDPVYGRRGNFTRHMLHAWKLTFTHPATGKRISFAAPLSTDFPEWAREATHNTRSV